MPIKPIDLREIDKRAANVYEAIIIAARKARLLNNEIKQEFQTSLSNIITTPEDEFEEKENPDQLRLSLEIEKKPKPHLAALNQFLQGDVEFRYKKPLF